MLYIPTVRPHVWDHIGVPRGDKALLLVDLVEEEVLEKGSKTDGASHSGDVYCQKIISKTLF